MEAKLRIEESKEATEMQRQFERLLALKENEFKTAQALMMEDAERREKKLRNAEVKAKEAEEQLALWRERQNCSRENVNSRSIFCMPWLS